MEAMFYRKANNLYEVVFYILFIGVIAGVFLTHPLLRIGFDVWYHLDVINQIFNNPDTVINRSLWHRIWAYVFRLTDVQDVIARAYAIHYTQYIITFLLVYNSSKIIIRNILLDDTNPEHIVLVKYAALWSSLIWLVIFATYSVGLHQVWIEWYSVNYQVTLPLFYYLSAITLDFIKNSNSRKSVFLYSVKAFSISLFIIYAHSMEYLYFIMHIIVLLILFNKKILNDYGWGKALGFVVLCFFLVGLVVEFYEDYRASQLAKMFLQNDLKGLLDLIWSYGVINVDEGHNRSSYSFNEMMIFSLLLVPVILYYMRNNKKEINVKVIYYLLITGLFVLIPMSKLTAGVAGILTHKYVVNRFYYSSLIFMFVPVAAMLETLYAPYVKKLKVSPCVTMNLLIFLSFSLVAAVSWEVKGNFAANITSISDSRNYDKVGLNYSQDVIDDVGRRLNYYDDKFSGMRVLFYARNDIAYIIKYIYKRDNVYFHRRKSLTYRGFLKKASRENMHPVVFDDNGLPVDERIFRYFSFDKKVNSDVKSQ